MISLAFNPDLELGNGHGTVCIIEIAEFRIRPGSSVIPFPTSTPGICGTPGVLAMLQRPAGAG